MNDSPMRTIERRLAAGEVVLLDGGTGTELERRGAPMHDAVWCAAATLSHGGLLRAVHEDYVRAGASVVIANTYASNRLMLEPAGLGGEFEAVNRRAVEVALEARDRAAGGDAVAVAGSMSHTLPMRHDPAHAPSPARAAECFSEMAGTLAAAGVDLIVLEMMSNPDLARPRARRRPRHRAAGVGSATARFAARAGSRSPFLPPGPRLRGPARRRAAVAGPGRRGHAHPRRPDGPRPRGAARPSSTGRPWPTPTAASSEMPHWRFVDVISPAELAGAAREWIRGRRAGRRRLLRPGGRARRGPCGDDRRPVALSPRPPPPSAAPSPRLPVRIQSGSVPRGGAGGGRGGSCLHRRERAREGEGREVVPPEERRRVRVVARRRLAALPHGAVEQEDRGAGPRRVVERVDEPRHPHFEAGLLAGFADRRLDRGLPVLQIAGGKAPLALLGLHRPAHEEEAAVLDHHHPHPDLRLDEVRPAARGARTAGLSRHPPGREAGPAADAVADVPGRGVRFVVRIDDPAPVVRWRNRARSASPAGDGGRTPGSRRAGSGQGLEDPGKHFVRIP